MKFITHAVNSALIKLIYVSKREDPSVWYATLQSLYKHFVDTNQILVNKYLYKI